MFRNSMDKCRRCGKTFNTYSHGQRMEYVTVRLLAESRDIPFGQIVMAERICYSCARDVSDFIGSSMKG